MTSIPILSDKDGMDEDKVFDIANTVARMSLDARRLFNQQLADILTDMAHDEAQRLAAMRAKSDFDLIHDVISVACPDEESSLRTLREGGFLRGDKLFEVYLAGFAASAEGYNAEHRPEAVNEMSFIERMGEDILEIIQRQP